MNTDVYAIIATLKSAQRVATDRDARMVINDKVQELYFRLLCSRVRP